MTPRQRRQETTSGAKATPAPRSIMRKSQAEISQHHAVAVAGGDQTKAQYFTAQVQFKIVVTVTLLCGLIAAAAQLA